MTRELDNLVAIRQLKAEPTSDSEVATLLQRAATVSAPMELWSALSAAHDRRNALAYSAAMSPSQTEVVDLLAHTRALDRLVRKASSHAR